MLVHRRQGHWNVGRLVDNTRVPTTKAKTRRDEKRYHMAGFKARKRRQSLDKMKFRQDKTNTRQKIKTRTKTKTKTRTKTKLKIKTKPKPKGKIPTKILKGRIIPLHPWDNA